MGETSVTIVEVYELLQTVSNVVNGIDEELTLSEYLQTLNDGEINSDTEQYLSDIIDEVTVYDTSSDEYTAFTILIDRLDTIHNDLLQIDACFKIFFVLACLVIFSKIFINTFFKGW